MTAEFTLAISTFGNRLLMAQAVVEQAQKVLPELDIVLIHQVPEVFVLDEAALRLQQRWQRSGDVNYVLSTTQGLTKSRNLAFEHARHAWVWLMDDDIVFCEGAFLTLCQRLAGASHLACLCFESLRESGGRRAVYPEDGAELNARQRLRVASFEIVVNRVFLAERGVSMREDMGVGSGCGITMGEESVLLSDIYRAGGLVQHCASALVVHPDISTGVIVSKENTYSKGVVLKRCFDGGEKFKFFCKDLLKILKDRDKTRGTFSKRLALSAALFKGCYRS
ncbi:glycosyltransferase family 2 protein [Agaribacterium haliotis]|uniref:glycosyltransferase family 2 protein n=1 Tax=Agaribacterium haliotis TaxID=2013869 RepID=UPI000BB572BC|nr:glycosyltransferase [Agaribacterium haliotis]